MLHLGAKAPDGALSRGGRDVTRLDAPPGDIARSPARHGVRDSRGPRPRLRHVECVRAISARCDPRTLLRPLGCSARDGSASFRPGMRHREACACASWGTVRVVSRARRAATALGASVAALRGAVRELNQGLHAVRVDAAQLAREARANLRRSVEPCGARCRDGHPCRAPVVIAWSTDGGWREAARCRMHGGLSTGPRTEAGRARSLDALARGRAVALARRAETSRAAPGDASPAPGGDAPPLPR